MKSRPNSRVGPWITRLRGGMIVASAVLLLATCGRNLLARELLERLGTRLLVSEVSVDHVHVGFPWLIVTGLRVADPDTPDTVLLSVDRIAIMPSVFDGLRRGIWLRRVDVQSPTIHVRLAPDVSLLSRLPTGCSDQCGGVGGPIPLQHVHVHQGRLVIDQVGRGRTEVAGVSLELVCGTTIRLRGEIAELLGGRMNIASQLSSQTFAGRTRLRIDGVLLDSRRLEQLPLLPELPDHDLRMRLDELVVDLIHPENPGDWQAYELTLAASGDPLTSDAFGDLLTDARLDATIREGRLSLSATSRPLAGSATLTATATWQDHRVLAELAVAGQSGGLADLVARSGIPVVADCRVESTGSAELTYDLAAGYATLAATVDTSLIDAHVDHVAIGDIKTRLVVQASHDRGAPNPLGGTVSGRIETAGISLADVADRLSLESLGGQITLTAQCEVPLARIADPDAVRGAAVMKLQGVRQGEFRLADTLCRLEVAGGISDGQSIQGTFALSPLDLRDVSHWVSQYSQTPLPLGGRADVQGQFRWAAPTTLSATGKIELHEASYATTRIGDAALDWDADSSGVRLRSESADFLSGRYALSATVRELDWTRTQITARVDEVPLRRLVSLADVAIPVDGTLSGQFDLTSIGSLGALRASGRMQGRGLSLGRQPLSLRNAELTIAEGTIRSELAGRFCDGHWTAAATAELEQLIAYTGADQARSDPLRLEALPVTFTADASGLSLARLATAVTPGNRRIPLVGHAGVRVVRDSQVIDDDLLAIATVTAERLGYEGIQLSDRIVADVSLRQDRVWVKQLSGRLADGRISGDADIDLRGVPRGNFRLAARHVNLRRLAGPWRSLAVSGRGDVTVQGRIAGSVSGVANVSVDNAEIEGMVIRHARLPIDWSYAADARIARWNCRGGTVELGGGKAILTSQGDFAGGLTTRSLVRLDRIDSAKLLRRQPLGLGIIDGQITINARKATAFQQFRGDFDIDLAKVNPLQIPILNQLPQMIQLPEVLPHDPNEDGGYLDGSFGGGVVRLARLALWQSSIQVMAQGKATYAGRLNLDVTVSTNRGGPADSLLALADSPLMLAAPAPVALVARANNLLKDRVVHVTVGGTTNRPILRLQPAKQLTQQAIRFFLRGVVGSHVVDASDRTRRRR